mgnify:CR=1 FL=1
MNAPQMHLDSAGATQTGQKACAIGTKNKGQTDGHY